MGNNWNPQTPLVGAHISVITPASFPSSITVDTLYYFALVSGVQHSRQTVTHCTKWAPQYFKAHLAPHVVITTSLTTFPAPYFTARDCFATPNLYVPIPSPFTQPSAPLRSGSHQSALCPESVSILCACLFCA